MKPASFCAGGGRSQINFWLVTFKPEPKFRPLSGHLKIKKLRQLPALAFFVVLSVLLKRSTYRASIIAFRVALGRIAAETIATFGI